MCASVRKLNYLNTRLVGILRTKPGTSATNATSAIETAFNSGAEAVEVTSNSDSWQEILSACVKKNLNIGVGSVKNEKIAKEAISLGAKFLVSPGFFEDAINAANENNIPILPGVFVKPNFEQALDLNIADVKFFPANVKTHEELFKAIREPFRDEFSELEGKGWTIVHYDPKSTTLNRQSTIVNSPTEFYKLYLEIKDQKPFGSIVIKLSEGPVGFERLKNFSLMASDHEIRTYAVGGISDKNMKEVLTNYGAYGVCPGSGMLNADAIFTGDFERVKADVSRHVAIIRDIYSGNSSI